MSAGHDERVREKLSTELVSWKDRIAGSNTIAKKGKMGHGHNYVQIATVDADNKPHNRTVVVRGFQDSVGNDCSGGERAVALRMITHGQSDKIIHAKTNDACEMVWWFPKTNEQYRLDGHLKFIGGGTASSVPLISAPPDELVKARKAQWVNLTDETREQMLWPQPGADYVPHSDLPSPIPAGGRDSEGNILPAPDNFLLMLLYPTKVKYLRLTDNYAQVDEVGEDGEWKFHRVNP